MPELTTTNTGELINIYMEKDTPYDGCLYEAMQRPFALSRKATRGGLIKVCLSHDGRFVATVSACTPTCIWLWDILATYFCEFDHNFTEFGLIIF